MDEDEVYASLPDDAGLAFVKLEEFFRDKYEEATRDSTENSVITFHQMTYLNKVIAAAKHLGIPGIKEYELPEDDRNLWDFSRLVTRDIESLGVQIRIANAKRRHSFSVALSAVEKAKARHFIDQLDQLVDESDCSQEKKDALKKKLSELRAEIEQNRVWFDRVAAKVMSIARLSGEIEEHGARPWWPYIKAFFGLIDEAKENEEQRSLPRHSESKKLAPPRKQLPNPKASRDLDDEVPF